MKQIEIFIKSKWAIFVSPHQLHKLIPIERRGSVVVSMSAWHAAGRRFDSQTRHVSLLGLKPGSQH